MPKLEEQKRAILLRQQGHSYNEILRHVPVAKATLSLWLRKVGLSKRQKQRLTLKKLEAGRRGAQAQREKRLRITREIKEKARADIDRISKRELWLMGIMLYWAEGTRERENSSPAGVQFSNSDPLMVKLFLKWLVEICKISTDHIKCALFIHENSKNKLDEVKEFWAKNLGLGMEDFQTVYFKKHKISSNRKRTGKEYNGLLKIVVRKSTSLNRKIAGWIDGINEYYCRVV